jgi:hypothetical protein
MTNILFLLLFVTSIFLVCTIYQKEGFTGKLNQATRPTLRYLRRKKNNGLAYMKMKLYNMYRKYL